VTAMVATRARRVRGVGRAISDAAGGGREDIRWPFG
jgi:hypothetical protein